MSGLGVSDQTRHDTWVPKGGRDGGDRLRECQEEAVVAVLAFRTGGQHAGLEGHRRLTGLLHGLRLLGRLWQLPAVGLMHPPRLGWNPRATSTRCTTRELPWCLADGYRRSGPKRLATLSRPAAPSTVPGHFTLEDWSRMFNQGVLTLLARPFGAPTFASRSGVSGRCPACSFWIFSGEHADLLAKAARVACSSAGASCAGLYG